MNKRGAVIGLNLLLLLSVVLSVAVLFAIALHGSSFGDLAKNNEEMIKQSQVIQDYIESSSKLIMYESAKSGFTRESVIKSAEKYNLHLVGQGDYFDKIERGDFIIETQGSSTVLEVNEILFFTQVEGSSIKRIYDLSIETDLNGEFIRFINK